MRSQIDKMEKEILASELKGSFLYFIQFFFKHLTGRDFIISTPIGRESHHITLCRVLTQAKRLEIPNHRLNINVPPGYGKSTILCMWIAWCLADFPDANFLYISYSFDLAVKHTAFIKNIMESRMYKYLFDVHLRKDTRARDSFETTAGGKIKAFGSGGAITGQDAGLPGLNRFSGAAIIDDAHKVDEAHSDTMRKKVLDNYVETIRQRPRGINVPIINVGQRVHEADLSDYFIGGQDITEWHSIVLKALDDAGNALYPEIDPVSKLHALQEKSPYVFASQFQQNPSPAGGGLFRPEWMLELDEEPKILMTFLTADTGETEKTYNDPSAISFLGLYEIEVFGRKTGELALHWIDCLEEWVEPHDLEDLFMGFWRESARHKIPPLIAVIEKKSTGVTLVSTMNKVQGIKIIDVERTVASGSKTVRYIEMQPYIASKRVTFTKGAKHVDKCKTHMAKITANNSHRHDDICDTLYDGVKIALIDKSLHIPSGFTANEAANDIMNVIGRQMQRTQIARAQRNELR
jgi:predicted phage terminase large subunit-like protein